MLSVVEESIREAIRKSDVPFLGLLGETLNSAARTALELSILANPTVSGYIRYLEHYPALFSVNLTHHIMQGMGQAGHFELYPHIQKAIGTSKELSTNDKENLWRAYRRAIVTLGFEPSPRVSGNHFMADEYLRQVGVPLAFADDLAERMLFFANRVGIPDEYDPEALIGWQMALDTRLEQNFSRTARKAVLLDTQGYYTRQFVKIHSRAGALNGDANALETAMARAFKGQQGNISFRRAVLPYLVLLDGSLGIFIPGGDEREYEIAVAGVNQLVRAGIEDKFFPITEPLPNEISVKELKGNQSTRYKLWEDHRPNRLLFFTDTGRYRGCAQLNQTEPLVLPPGKYTVLSRFNPSGVDTEQLLDDPQLFIFTRQIHPGEKHILSNGPASLKIVGESQPFAAWQGASKTTKEGVEFFLGNVSLDVEFPHEWISLAGNKFLLRLTAVGISESLELPIAADENGKFSINIANEATKRGWKPGFTRLVAEVYRANENRSLIRVSAFIWLGLISVTNGLVFECSSLPINLQTQLNENVQSNRNTLKPKDVLTRIFRVVFKLDEKRNQSLTWNVPGIYVEVETLSDNGGTTRTAREIGSVEAISITSPKQIIISASDDGELRLGNWRQSVVFSRVQSKRLAAAFLASRITPQQNCLIFKNERTGNQCELLRFVQPHHVNGISGKASGGQLKIEIRLPKDLEAITVRALDVVSGNDFEVTLEANSHQQTLHRFGRAQLMCLHGEAGEFAAYVLFSLDFWPAGAWVFQFDGKIDGIWGHLENERQDQFSFGFLCDEQGVNLTIQMFLDSLTELTDKQSLDMLVRVQEAMLPCYAMESWNSMRWLAEAWNYLLSKWEGRLSEAIDILYPLAALRPPEDSSPSWLLQQTIGSRIPKIFGLQGDKYRTVPTKHNPLVQAAQVLCQFKSRYPDVFPELINPVAAAGFCNFAEVARGGTPKGYSIARYVDALRETGAADGDLYRLEDTGFAPVSGDFLSGLHYKYAMRKLEEAFERCRSGNDLRLGQVILLCNYVRRVMPVLSREDSPNLAGASPHINPWPFQEEDGVESELAQRNENLQVIGITLSWLAYHCRLEAKSSGLLDEFLNKLRPSGAPVESSLAYLLQIGDAAFAYYLVLWELVVTSEHIAG